MIAPWPASCRTRSTSSGRTPTCANAMRRSRRASSPNRSSMADRCGAARGDSSGAVATAMRDARDTDGPRSGELLSVLGTRRGKSKADGGVLDSDAAARCAPRVALTLRALLAFAVVSTMATLAAQVALHLAAHRAARAHDPFPDDEAPPGSADVLRAIVRETVLSLLVVLVWPFALRSAGTGGRGVVVLVHDFACSPASLWLLARRLRRDGWAVIVPRLGVWWSDL